MAENTVVIIGAGPAGLTAAFELLKHPGIKPVVLEATDDVGGISRTIEYHGNRMDIGGHRFFSKSDRVMDWWLDILPLQRLTETTENEIQVAYQGRHRSARVAADAPDPELEDRVFLVRRRLSRILHDGRFYDYPVTLSLATLRKLGLPRTARIGLSYLRSAVRPVRPEVTLEDFFVNRFGRELYRTFFRDYTEKVWGVPCTEIPADWGAQRVKGLSVSRAIVHALRGLIARDASLDQKGTETSLIERFLYPKHGPGQMWGEVRRRVEAKGGEVRLQHRVHGLKVEGQRILAVVARNEATGEQVEIAADWVLSSMPIRALVAGLDTPPPTTIADIADGLRYRDFMTVGLLLERLRPLDRTLQRPPRHILPDTWIYVQEARVKLGRIQVFNNWSPYMVADPDTVWLGLEYFCAAGDELWSRPDDSMVRFAADELERIGLIDAAAVRDATVVRQPKAYPAYTGTYDRFEQLRDFLDSFHNLMLIGRNGMHKYNNQDHSMLTAMTAVECLVTGRRDSRRIWDINTEQDYHEEAREG